MHITLGAMVSWMHSAGLTLVSFAVLISVIVFFHELGHLVVGKWLGVKAVRFSIGFGPKLFGFQWGETDASETGDFAFPFERLAAPGNGFFDLNNRTSSLQTAALQAGMNVMSGTFMQRVTNACRAALLKARTS